MSKLWSLEPTAIIGLITAGLSLAVAFGVSVTTEQTEAIKSFAQAMLIIGAALVTRSQVIPAAKVEAAHGEKGVREASAIRGGDLE